MTRHTLPFVLLAALLAMPAAVTAQLYKWVDEDGGVNYGDTPPPKAKNVRPVGQGSVSVVPGVPKDQIDAMRERDEQRRKEREQRDADQARAADNAHGPPLRVNRNTRTATYPTMVIGRYARGRPTSARTGLARRSPSHDPRPLPVRRPWENPTSCAGARVCTRRSSIATAREPP